MSVCPGLDPHSKSKGGGGGQGDINIEFRSKGGGGGGAPPAPHSWIQPWCHAVLMFKTGINMDSESFKCGQFLKTDSYRASLTLDTL